MSDLRFAVDSMLGRLATWLRLLGYDATYVPPGHPSALLRHARVEGRIVLTRNHRLAAIRATVAVHLVAQDRFRDQLQDIVTAFSLDTSARLLTRCCRCNQPLEPVPPETVTHEVPPHVLRTQPRFVRCPACRRVYWPATHDAHVRAEIRRLGLCPGPDNRTPARQRLH